MSGGGGGGGLPILVFIRLRTAMQSSDFSRRAIACMCIMFPLSHAAVGAYPRLDAVSSIIASSHSPISLVLTSFSPELTLPADIRHARDGLALVGARWPPGSRRQRMQQPWNDRRVRPARPWHKMFERNFLRSREAPFTVSLGRAQVSSILARLAWYARFRAVPMCRLRWRLHCRLRRLGICRVAFGAVPQ